MSRTYEPRKREGLVGERREERGRGGETVQPVGSVHCTAHKKNQDLSIFNLFCRSL